MAAVWVLLGKTLFPATFFQSYKGKITEVTIPFDITLDVIPDYLRHPDVQLQQLALANPGDVKGFEQIKGTSKHLMLAVRRAERAAIRDVAVLLTGESGTGKEMFARAMHRASHRGRQDEGFVKFVALNCAAIPDTLFESELFGVEKGAYTDAKESRPGAFERANNGTLLLDEVGELSPQNQAKLLRALQPPIDGGPCSRLVRRVGGKTDIPCDVRIIAATNQNLVEGIKNHQFRDDLFYRLGVIQIRLPSLRDRRTDIEILAGEILRRVNIDFQKTEIGYAERKLTPEGLRRLRKHNWPGNIRELQNVLTQAAVFAVSPDIINVDIDSAIASFEGSANEAIFSTSRGDHFVLSERLEEIEQVFIKDAMNETDHNQTKAAELLGISQQALSKKLKSQKSRARSIDNQ
jgi:transcriptional regulator with PAS, ATPase and Fis domain